MYQMNLKVLKNYNNRIVFEKIVVMPKGQQRNTKGAICNIPVDCDQTYCLIPPKDLVLFF